MYKYAETYVNIVQICKIVLTNDKIKRMMRT